MVLPIFNDFIMVVHQMLGGGGVWGPRPSGFTKGAPKKGKGKKRKRKKGRKGGAKKEKDR